MKMSYISFHVVSSLMSTSYPLMYLVMFYNVITCIINAVMRLLLIVEAVLNEQQTVDWFYLNIIVKYHERVVFRPICF